MTRAAPPAAAASTTTRPAPGPTSTEHDLLRARLALERSLVVDAYAASGRRDPRWDADATAFLAARLPGAIDDLAERFYKPGDVMPRAARAQPPLRAAMDVDDRSAIPPTWMMTLEQLRPEFEGVAHRRALEA